MPHPGGRLDSASRLNQQDSASAHAFNKNDLHGLNVSPSLVSHCSPHLVVIDFSHADEKEDSQENSFQEKNIEESQEEGPEEKSREHETKWSESKYPLGKLRAPQHTRPRRSD